MKSDVRSRASARARWDQRIARARQLASDHPPAAEILAFYVALAEQQKALLERGSDGKRGRESFSTARLEAEKTPDPFFHEKDSRPLFFFEALDLEPALAAIPDFLLWLQRLAPAPLVEAATEMCRLDQSTWRERMVAYLTHNPLSPGAPAAAAEHAGRGPQRGSRAGVPGARQRESGWGPTSNEKNGERVRVRGSVSRDEIAEFVVEAVLQPFAEAAAIPWRDHVRVEAPAARADLSDSKVATRPERRAPSAQRLETCPLCGDRPVVGVLREEGQSARRMLVCGLCLIEWEYLRILCPGCAEQHFDALPVYVAEEFPHIRIEACESCRYYLKTVDLTKNGLAVPLVDDIASLALDLWAREQGYVRLRPNLLRM